MTLDRVRHAIVVALALPLTLLAAAGCEDPNPALELSSNANLSSLALAETTISPAFSPELDAYTASVPNDVDTVTVSATTADPAADVISGIGEQPLTEGENAIGVVVRAEDSTERTYTITVTRDSAPVSQCGAGSPCAAGEICVNGVCRTACASDSDCGPGFDCLNGACVPE